MSEVYKTFPGGLYFVTITTIGWVDIFTRRLYQDIVTDSIIYCQKNKGLQLYCYCIMPSHVHIIASREEGTLNDLMRDMKSFTAPLAQVFRLVPYYHSSSTKSISPLLPQ